MTFSSVALLKPPVLGTWWSALLVAAAAVALPVLLHLWNRGRVRVVPWAGMRFVREAVRRTQRRAVWEERLLLAARVGVILLILGAAVLAQPWAVDAAASLGFPVEAKTAAGSKTHSVVVLDASLSMSHRAYSESCFDRAKREVVENLIRPAKPGDAFSVVLMGSPPESLFTPAHHQDDAPCDDHEEAARQVGELRPTHGAADLIKTGVLVASILDRSRQSGRYQRYEVYWLTDLQAGTWRQRPEQATELREHLKRMSELAWVRLVDLGAQRPFNLAVTHLAADRAFCTTRDEVTFTATVRAWGRGGLDRVAAGLWVGTPDSPRSQTPFGNAPPRNSVSPATGNRVSKTGRSQTEFGNEEPVAMQLQSRQEIQLSPGDVPPAGREARVEFRHRFAAPGTYAIQVRIESRDGLEPDDVASLVVTVRDQLPVLVVDGMAAGPPEEHESHYLRHALANPRLGVDVRVATSWELAQQAPGSPNSIEAVDCIFLCNVARLAPREIQRLESHLRRGGGLAFFLGDQVDAAHYNLRLHRGGEGLLPVEILGRVPDRGESPRDFYSFDPRGYQHPLLQEFAGRPNSGLLRARTWRYLRVRTSPRSGAQVVLNLFPDGSSSKQIARADGSAGVSPGQSGRDARAPRPQVTDAALEAAPETADPAMVEAGYGVGRVIVVTTAAGLKWSGWPLNPSFVPLIQEMLLFAPTGRHQQRSASVGEALEHAFPEGVTECQVVMPDGRQESALLVDQHGTKTARFERTSQSGFYRFVASGAREADGLPPLGPPLRKGGIQGGGPETAPQLPVFAVNVPPLGSSGEADPSKLTDEQLQALYPEWKYAYLTRCRASALPAIELATNFRQHFLLAALLLLLVEVALAWHIVATTWNFPNQGLGIRDGPNPQSNPFHPSPLRTLLRLWLGSISALLLVLIGVIVHYAWTGELLGFLPASWRLALETSLQIAPPATGEGRSWHLEPHAGPGWIWYAIMAGVVAVVVWGYLRGRSPFGRLGRTALAVTRLTVLAIIVGLMLPEWVLAIQNHGRPSIIFVLDDSQSMQGWPGLNLRNPGRGIEDSAPATPKTRFDVAREQLLNEELIYEVLHERQMKARVYAVGVDARFLGQFTGDEEAGAISTAQGLAPNSPESRLAGGLRQILDESRSSRPAALVMWSDFASTDGVRLQSVGAHARDCGLPLFLISVGQSGRSPTLRLHDLQVNDSVHVHDTLVFEARLTAEGHAGGYKERTVTVQLRERDGDRPLATKQLRVTPGVPAKVRLEYRPTEPGDRTFLLELDETNKATSAAARLQQRVAVLPVKPLKVLYLEGYPRYEYRCLKTLLERQTDPATGRRLVDLKTILFDGDPGVALQDESALAAMPSAKELESFDVIIFGDVNPESLRPSAEHLRNLRDYVRVHGGGFLMIAGERHAPHAYRQTPLAEILPIEILKPQARAEETKREPYSLILPAGAGTHPLFAAIPQEAWSGLEKQWWAADDYRARPEADILAVHPQRQARGPAVTAGTAVLLENWHPLILDWLPGSGRSVFFGFQETWCWRQLDGEALYNRFWLHTLRYLARTRPGQVSLGLDRQEAYRRGDTIRLTVRFPEEMRRIPEDSRLVLMQRFTPAGNHLVNSEIRQLQRLPEARGLYELRVENAEEGRHRFRLVTPDVAARPEVECHVVGSVAESEQQGMDVDDVRAAAAMSGGRFYTAATAAELLKDLPRGKETPLEKVSEIPLWDHPLIWCLALALLVSEWFLRRGKGVL